jgi:hypothetical protein
MANPAIARPASARLDRGRRFTAFVNQGEFGMIGYATVGGNDLEKARRFFDAMLDTLGGRRAFASGLDGDKLCIFKRG